MNQKTLLSSLGAFLLAGAVVQGQVVLTSVGWSLFETGTDAYSLGQSATLVAGVDNTAYWNDLNAPTGSVGAPTPDPAWTGFVNSAGTSISGTAQVTATSANNFTGVANWAGISESTTGHDKMMGAGAMNWHNNAAAAFTISVAGLPQAFVDHTGGFIVRAYWGGVSQSSADDSHIVETVYTIGTESGSLTFGGGADDNNWEVRDNSTYILDGNYVELELASLNEFAGFDLVISRGDENRRIGISGFEIVPIPEPSTYAALIGLLALGLVIYRRRK
ncbi:MAG: PEP-CTERM sorting domain-containing protein [Opitutales bacterium]|nr:PEP-CTERM sorting domain-containing protein [Opitutales bacterium]